MGGSGDTAKTLILVGLILDVVAEVILLIAGVFLLVAPILGGLLLGFAVVGLIWIFLVYVFSYERVREGDYEGARTPTLVIAILSLVTLALIPGILFLIAYVKLGDAAQEEPNVTVPWGAAPIPQAPIPGTPLASGAQGMKVCAHCGRANAGSNLFCQGCGAPL